MLRELGAHAKQEKLNGLEMVKKIHIILKPFSE